MSGFAKLFSSIITSSIWSEDDKTRIMWVTMLAASDSDGFVTGSMPGMAAMARMNLQDAEKSIKALTMPDPYSRSKEYDGRRLLECEGGWLIANYTKYRQQQDPEKRRKQNREAQKRYRCKQKVSQSNQEVINGNQLSAQAEAEADNIHTSPKETRVDEQSQAKGQKPGSKVAAASSDDGGLFERFWSVYPRKVGKQDCRKIWARLKPSAELTGQIVNSVKAYKRTAQWQEANGKYIPHPETFLNKARWQDEIPNDDDGPDMYKLLGTRKATNEDIERLKAKGIL